MKKIKHIIAVSLLAAALAAGGCGLKTSKSGIITEATGKTISITASDGAVYTYSTDESTSFSDNAGRLGDTVEIRSSSYSDGVHADSVKLISAASYTPCPANTINGQLKEVSFSSLIITANNGIDYTLQWDKSTVIHSSEGLRESEFVEIMYTGELDDGTASASDIIITTADVFQNAPRPVSEASPAAEKRASESASPTLKPTSEPSRFSTGQCGDISMNKVTFVYSGVEYSVQTTEDTQMIGNIEKGDTVRIFHNGTLRDGITASKVLLISKAGAAEPEPDASDANDNDTQLGAEERVISGTVADAATHTVMLELPDGTRVNFVKNESSKLEGSETIGARVTISYVYDGEGRRIIKALK